MNKLAKKITFSLLSLLAVGTMIGADVAYTTFEADILGQLCPPIVDESAASVAKSEGMDLAKKIEEEGIVMVKNDGTLPLSTKNTSAINLLGYGNVQWIYGGSGSGRVLAESDNWADNIDLADALDEYGIDVNEDLLDFYKSYATPNFDIDTLNFNVDNNPYRFGLKDPDINNSQYATLLEQSLDFSDTAIVTISRQGGESEDMPAVQYKSKPSQKTDSERHSLEISQEEEDLLYFAQDNFENVIVVINSTNAFQLDFLAEMPGIDACLIVGPTGEQGAHAIPKVLFGEVSPSGKLADTLAYDFTKNLNFNYTGFDGVSFYSNKDTAYGVGQTTNAGVTTRPSLPYIDYVEDIYVGYRYYETADVEGMFKDETRDILDENGAEKTLRGYDAVVQYPFGYGLSYTTFDWEVISIDVPSGAALTADSKINISVKVTNTGDVAGKDVVELYQTPEYKANGIEKSAANLIGFEKTELIKPGENETVKFEVSMRDFASYDAYDKNNNGKTTYEVEKGNYQLKFATDAHRVKTIDFLGGEKNVAGVLTYHVDSDIILDKDPVTNKTIDNLFTGAKAIDGVSVDGGEGENADIPYVSRGDFKNLTGPIEQSSTHDAATGRAMGAKTKEYVTFAGRDGKDQSKANAWDNATTDLFGNEIANEEVLFGQSGNLKVADNNGVPTELGYQLGADYHDPQWNNVLNQVSYAEAMGMVNNAHPNCKGIASIGMPNLVNYDGPAQVGSFTTFASNEQKYRGVGFPADFVLAQTWNKTLAYEEGLSLGADMEAHGLTGFYGTAINIHRSPFGGRNYEYYSEDPILTGKLAAMLTKGVKDTGKMSFVKHFAVAETETSRDSLYTWLTEQALREIYLEPFRIVVEEGGANALMTSYNRVGALWAGGSTALLQGVLRGEWGFNGSIITDYSDNNQFMNMDETLRCGGDLGMSVSLKFNISASSTNRAKMALREAVHHTVYSYLNSKYALQEYNKHPYNGKEITSANTKEAFNWVTPVVVDFNIVLGVTALGLIYFGVFDAIGLDRPLAKKEKEEA